MQDKKAVVGMNMENYSTTFAKILGDITAEIFKCLDSDKNGKVDAYEVFAVLIMCSSTQPNRKKKLIFDVFDLISMNAVSSRRPCQEVIVDQRIHIGTKSLPPFPSPEMTVI